MVSAKAVGVAETVYHIAAAVRCCCCDRCCGCLSGLLRSNFVCARFCKLMIYWGQVTNDAMELSCEIQVCIPSIQTGSSALRP
jgi:hypothetical protein